MTEEQELRTKQLTRIAHEKIIKYGTYNMCSDVQNKTDEPVEEVADISSSENELSPEEIAAQIMSSNFRTGLTQSEVDSILNGL